MSSKKKSKGSSKKKNTTVETPVKEDVVVAQETEVKEEVVTKREEATTVEPLFEDIKMEKEEDAINHTQKIDVITESLKSDTNIGFVVEDKDRPRLYHHIFHPLYCVEKANQEVDFSIFKSLLLTFIKTGLSVVLYIDWFSKLLNREAFSYARLTFSDSSWLWFRVTMGGLISEIIIYIVTAIAMKLAKKRGGFKKLFGVQSALWLSIALLFLVCSLLTFVNNTLAIVGMCIAFASSILMHYETSKIVTGFAPGKMIRVHTIGFALAVLWCLIFVRFAGNDIAQIFSVILNY